MMGLFSSLALFLTPSFYFSIQNLGLAKDGELFLTTVMSAALFGIITLILSPVIFLKREKFFFSALTFISAFWYFQFFILNNFAGNNNFLPTIIISLLSLLVTFISIKINITKFLLMFLGLNLVVAIFPKTDYFYSILSKNLVAHESNKVTKITPKVKDVNVYYVLADGLTSLYALRNKYNIPINEFEEKLKAHKYSVIEHSKSSYNTTYLSLAAIFSLDYPVTESTQKYKDRLEFFPSMLSTPDRVPLLRKLDTLNYKFVHIGNKWNACSKNELVNCFSEHQNTPLKFFISKFFENYTIQTFLQNTIFERITSILLRGNKFEYELYKQEVKTSQNENDALGRITNSIKSKKIDLDGATFYFIHHFNPHPPALKEDCSVSDDKDYQKWTSDGYSESSICALNKISDFVKAINEFDPRAIVVIQGDHGPAITYNFEKNLESIDKNELEERFSIFNAIKLAEGCALPNIKNLGNVETIQLVMDCITGSKTMNEHSKSYLGFYEKHKNYGRVFEIDFKRLSR